jgi:hypothetical protein
MMRTVCQIASDGPLELSNLLMALCTKTLRMISGKVVLQAFTRLRKPELVQLIFTYFDQFNDGIFYPNADEAYRNQPDYLVRAINFGRVAFIRHLLSRSPDQELRDWHFIDPQSERRHFHDLWLNAYQYNTPLLLQFQLPRPSNIESSFNENVRIVPHAQIKMPIPLGILPSSSVHSSKEQIECGVCYESVGAEEQVHFECSHAYCYKCATQVYKTHHQSCAMCRKPTRALFLQTKERLDFQKRYLLESNDLITEII